MVHKTSRQVWRARSRCAGDEGGGSDAQTAFVAVCFPERDSREPCRSPRHHFPHSPFVATDTMPPSKLTPQQRSAQLAQQSHEKMLKADKLIVAEAMRVHGGPAISAAKQNFQQLGFIDSSGNIVKPSGPAVPYTSAKASQLLQLAATPANVEWDHGIGQSWGESDLKKLREMMSAVDSVALSEANIRRLGKKHAREPPRAPLLQHFEFFFALDPNSQVPEFDTWGELVSFLKSRYVAHGERALMGPMPVDFATSGVYGLSFSEGMWRINHRIAGVSVDLIIVNDPVGNQQLFVEQNYSDVRAMVRSKMDSNLMITCSNIIPIGATDTSAVEDDSVPTPTITPLKKRRRSMLALADAASPANGVPAASSRASPSGVVASSPHASGPSAALAPFVESDASTEQVAAPPLEMSAARVAEAGFAPPPPADE